MRGSFRLTTTTTAILSYCSRGAAFLAYTDNTRGPLTRCAMEAFTRGMSSSAAPEDLNDDQVAMSSSEIDIFHLRRMVDSTQDEAKRLLGVHRASSSNTNDDNYQKSLAVVADHQRNGRGTSGRAWVAQQGNLFLTCAIPMDVVPMAKVTLLPIGVGVLIAEQLAHHAACRPVVKWPNDVLLDGCKVAGTLIENHRVGQHHYWLIGIGVNIESHPFELPSEETDFRAMPRAATSLREKSRPGEELPTALDFGVSLATRLQSWTNELISADSATLVAKWKSWADLGSNYEIRETGEIVSALGIEPDGRLRVVGPDGVERLLVADYLF